MDIIKYNTIPHSNLLFLHSGLEHSSFNLVPNPDHFWRVKLESISPHTHDTFLLDCRFPSGNYLNPPAGAHVFLRRRIGAGGGGATAVLSSGGVINDGGAEEGKLVSRPYTPIHPSFEEGNVKNLDGTSLVGISCHLSAVLFMYMFSA